MHKVVHSTRPTFDSSSTSPTFRPSDPLHGVFAVGCSACLYATELSCSTYAPCYTYAPWLRSQADLRGNSPGPLRALKTGTLFAYAQPLLVTRMLRGWSTNTLFTGSPHYAAYLSRSEHRYQVRQRVLEYVVKQGALTGADQPADIREGPLAPQKIGWIIAGSTASVVSSTARLSRVPADFRGPQTLIICFISSMQHALHYHKPKGATSG